MKKVVILQKYLTPYRVPLFNAIARDPGVDLTLVYYGKPEARRRWSAFADRDFAEVEARCISIGAGYERNLELPFSLMKDLERIRPDMIICAPDSGGIAAFLYALKRTIRYAIWSEATPATEGKVSFLKGQLRQAIYRRAQSFIVPGCLSEEYIRHYLPRASFHYAPNTIEEGRFRLTTEELSKKFANERLILTFSGSLIERKGILLLLEAYALLLKNHPELRKTCLLRVMGTGPLDISAYQAYGIEMTGFCEQETYARYFQESHLFVLPSLHDNNPLAVVEGLFTGNVLVVSDGVGNYPEAVRGNGCVVPSNSVVVLFRTLERILALPRTELLRMAAASLEIAREFSVERSMNAFLAAIHAERGFCTASSRQAG